MLYHLLYKRIIFYKIKILIINLVRIFYLYLTNMINEVNLALQNPIENRQSLKSLSFELCNYNMNMNCGACISEAVMLLGNWLKEQGQHNDYKSRALKGEFELKRINLFVQVYQSNNIERQKELDTCLEINKSLNVNGVPYFNIIQINDRLTFKQMFEMTKQYPNDINIIANSDIYFDETILHVRWLKKRECFALSRWDYNEGKAILFNRRDSQDAWCFNGPVPEDIGDYFLGIPGCDNKIAYELMNHGYSILNPSKSIHAIHLHNTEFRTYNAKTERVPEPYHFIFPHL